MMKSVFYFCTVLAVFGLCACAHQEQTPTKTPTPTVQYKALELSEQQKAVIAEEKERLAEEKKVSRQLKTHSLGIIGAVEPIYFLPMKGAFLARIDTGAQGSSVDVENLQEFEREGKKWVSFDLVNQRTGEKHHYEKRFVTHSTESCYKTKQIVGEKRQKKHCVKKQNVLTFCKTPVFIEHFIAAYPYDKLYAARSAEKEREHRTGYYSDRRIKNRPPYSEKRYSGKRCDRRRQRQNGDL